MGIGAGSIFILLLIYLLFLIGGASNSEKSLSASIFNFAFETYCKSERSCSKHRWFNEVVSQGSRIR